MVKLKELLLELQEEIDLLKRDNTVKEAVVEQKEDDLMLMQDAHDQLQADLDWGNEEEVQQDLELGETDPMPTLQKFRTAQLQDVVMRSIMIQIDRIQVGEDVDSRI